MAARSTEVSFGPFRLDPASGGLRRGDGRVALQPRPLAVLRYLADRRGRVVSGEELLREVWAGTAVTRGVLKVAVRAIREALGDDAEAPRYVETVGREGYRLLEEGASAEPDRAQSPRLARAMVGRAGDLEQLRRAFHESFEGTRRVVLIAGEAGIGKTTLLDHLLAPIEQHPDVYVARGQCLERHGEGEPYLPVLEALGRLCREDGAEWLVPALRRHAPSWVAQLPGLGDSADEERVREASTPERMLRELADAFAVATQERCLVLALEDLHWSDHATLDLISCLAQRREAARLLVVGTYRPSDVIVHGHPLRDLKRQLVARSQCEELVLELLGAGDVAEYLRRELGESADLAALAGALQAHTAGHPLFMTSVVDDLLTGKRVVRQAGGWQLAGTAAEATEAIPAGVQQLIEQQAERLPPDDQRLLEAASVAGAEFSVASVAAALELDADDVETSCEALAARGQFIEAAGLAEWPDGTLCGRYRFRHPLRCHVLYRRIAEPRRVRLHRAIAAREEVGYGARASEIATDLAGHFERGREYPRAVAHREAAGHTALRRHAPREAAAHYEHALELLAELPASRERDLAELRVRVALAAPLMAVRGYAAPEVGASYERARSLCGSLGAEGELLPVLRGLASYHQVRGELGVARGLGDELLARAAAVGDLVAQVQAHYGHGVTLFHAGEPVLARAHLERALALHSDAQQAQHARVYGGYDPSVACRLWLAWTLQVLDLGEQGRARAAEALGLAEALGQPLTLTFAHYGVAATHQTLGEWPDVLRFAERAIALAEEHGFAYELALATILRGWAHALQSRVADGIAELERGIELYTATGARLASGYGMMLAAAVAMAGRLEEARDLARRALDATKGRERGLDGVEVLRGAARIFLAVAAEKREPERTGLEREAEALLEEAVALARAQRAPLLELLAATSLARHWDSSGRRAAARELLAPVVARFAPDHATHDLRQAADLLAKLGGSASG